MIVFNELLALLGRHDAGPLTIHMDAEGSHLMLHFAVKGNNPKGVVKRLHLGQATALRVGADHALADVVKALGAELDGVDPPVGRCHLEVI